MTDHPVSARHWGERLGLAVLFGTIGLLIMTVFSPWQPTLPRVADYLGRVGLILVLLILTGVVRKSARYGLYWRVLVGLLIMAIAVSLDWVFARFLIDFLGVTGETPAGIALLKLNECAVIVIVTVLGTRMSGENLGSLYIQRGRLRLGLTIGLIAFAVAAAGAVPMAGLMFYGQDLTVARIAPWIPWVLIFVLANATMEELLFRGLFLHRLERHYGKAIANFLIAFVFTGLHAVVNYTPDRVLFLAVLFPLALAWGYITQKTEGSWGSILFHAGMDIPIVLGLFSNP